MNSPKYDLRLNPVYQVDFSSSASGKRVSATKRRVRWRFGFSNAQAIAEGVTGQGARGEEHQIDLIWSLTSGKRQVLADGDEVHFSQGRRSETKFEATWTMNGGHVMKLVAHAVPAVFGDKNFRQFDLLLDGMSFFDMPRIFELGVVDGVARAVAPREVSHARGRALLPSREETWDYTAEQAFDAQFYVNRNLSANSAPALMNHDVRSPREREDSLPSDLVSDPTPVNYVQDHFSTPVALIDRPPSVSSAPTVPAVTDEFTPAVPPPPTFQTISSEIMSAYGPPQITPAFPALTYEHANQSEEERTPPPQDFAPSVAPQEQWIAPPSKPQEQWTSPLPQEQWTSPLPQEQWTSPPAFAASSPTPNVVSPPPSPEQALPPPPSYPPPTMNSPLSVMDAPTEEPANEVDRAMKNLVNLDDITEQPVAPETLKLTMKKEEVANINKSHALPPTTGYLGSQATLSQIQAHGSATRASPSKEVMRTHAFDPAAAQNGTMVVYGAPPPQQQAGFVSPPSIPQISGFGAGAQVTYAPTFAAY
eukprot:CAMPEP_0116861036 /NCGR_PEP_ID=MMETSP0418-20121206/22792_1 /TAXON_ID=1158023 /ORGANISM="Astrosyne radiata, Strain 13vi08-1A" /LENGTH=534 /DNA_ID=CAMNT_0004495599 /DNA_START=14 /DNA_END=1618 /DNA_ORIENTATION=+